jgi:hypothetical protein
MKPCRRISKKVRDRVVRLYFADPALSIVEAAAACGYSKERLDYLCRRVIRALRREGEAQIVHGR